MREIHSAGRVTGSAYGGHDIIGTTKNAGVLTGHGDVCFGGVVCIPGSHINIVRNADSSRRSTEGDVLLIVGYCDLFCLWSYNIISYEYHTRARMRIVPQTEYLRITYRMI